MPKKENTLRRLQIALEELHNSGHSWRTIASRPEFEPLARVSKAPHVILQRIVIDMYEPKGAEMRAALQLPILRPAPVCQCGEVHLSKICPNQPKKRTNWYAFPLADLRRALEEREEYPNE